MWSGEGTWPNDRVPASMSIAKTEGSLYIRTSEGHWERAWFRLEGEIEPYLHCFRFEARLAPHEEFPLHSWFLGEGSIAAQAPPHDVGASSSWSFLYFETGAPHRLGCLEKNPLRKRCVLAADSDPERLRWIRDIDQVILDCEFIDSFDEV